MVATPPVWLAELVAKQERALAATKLQAQMRGRNARKSIVAAPVPMRGPSAQAPWEQSKYGNMQDDAALLAAMGLGSEEELSAEWAAAEAEAIAVLHKYVTAAIVAASSQLLQGQQSPTAIF